MQRPDALKVKQIAIDVNLRFYAKLGKTPKRCAHVNVTELECRHFRCQEGDPGLMTLSFSESRHPSDPWGSHRENPANIAARRLA